MQDTGTLTSGQFARIAGLSAKALRLYEVSGLLPPAGVAPGSKYRHYRRDQLDRARRIGLLRQAGMPLAVIAETLAGTDAQALERLDAWWITEEAATHARRSTVNWMRHQFADNAEPERDYPVSFRRVRDRKIATLRLDTSMAGLVEAMHGAEWRIREHLDRHGATVTVERWVIHFGLLTPDGEAEIEVCVPFSGSVEPDGDITVRMEPAHREAYTSVARDDCFYPRILRAYEALRRTDAVPIGPTRELYLAQWDRIGGEEPFVEVAQPVADQPVAGRSAADQPDQDTQIEEQP